MLASIQFYPPEIDIAIQYEISTTILSLTRYFQKFNYTHTVDDVMQVAYEHACTHYDPNKGELVPYIKKLAQNLSKSKEKYKSVQYLDTYMGNGIEETGIEEVASSSCLSYTVAYNEGLGYNLQQEVIELALDYMTDFVRFARAFRTLNTSTLRLKDAFKKSVNKLCVRYGDAGLVTKEITDLYNTYEEDFLWFLELAEGAEDIGTWTEKRDKKLRVTRSYIRLKGKDTLGDFDADYDEYVLVGSLVPTQKRVLKVDFEDVWEHMCDKLDSDETNECVFVLGNNRLVRTYANGVMEELNIDLYKVYDIVREEIATNILRDLGGVLLHLGSKSVYLLVKATDTPYTIPKKVIKGYEIEFKITDITEDLLVEEEDKS